ncbi:(Fe-S)-binding protein [Desulfolithobacter dissulfuricans]|uniref:(Fe-S)-binding protein n=1 Tax=Desulfolithobacter dissulfuricans TaxID=2795293 RepID=UPI0022792011|nr:(Fe-S)-binding protein [Desulfolithobacter dissulfuricans]
MEQRDTLDKAVRDCAKCGSCSVVCPVYRVSGRESLTARGRLHLLGTELAGAASPRFQEIFSRCLLCGACESVCPRNLEVTEVVSLARSRFPRFYGPHGVVKELARMTLDHPALLQGLVRAGISLKRLQALPATSGLRIRLSILEEVSGSGMPEPHLEGQGAADTDPGIQYFTGCLARYLQPSVAGATQKLCRAATGMSAVAPGVQACCGLAAWSAGKRDQARELARQNIQAFGDSSGPILTSCASCSAHLKRYPELFPDDSSWQERAREFSRRVCEFSEFFLAHRQRVSFVARNGVPVFYHDPCHLRFSAPGREMPRKLIKTVAGAYLLNPERPGPCCGQGGLFHLGCPDLSDRIFTRAAESALAQGPELVVTTCSGCLMQWQQGMIRRGKPVAVTHLAVFLAGCLGQDTPELPREVVMEAE